MDQTTATHFGMWVHSLTLPVQNSTVLSVHLAWISCALFIILGAGAPRVHQFIYLFFFFFFWVLGINYGSLMLHLLVIMGFDCFHLSNQLAGILEKHLCA